MRRTVNDTQQHRLKTMHRPQAPQVRQQAKAASGAASAGNSLEYWRKQAAKASEREREALKLAAEYQAKEQALSHELTLIKDSLYKLLK